MADVKWGRTAAADEYDLTPLNKLDDTAFQTLINGVTTYMVENKISSDDIMFVVQQLAEETSASISALKNVVKTVLQLLNGIAKRCVSASVLEKELISSGLGNEKAAAMAEMWRENFLAICRNAMSNTFLINKLIDMEWKFGVSSSSSGANQLGSSFLQLKLTLSKGDGDAEHVYMELTLPQFYTFLHEMEKAKTSLDVHS